MTDPHTGLNVTPGPKTVAVAGMGQSEEHSLHEQIELDRYRRANCANRFFGIRRIKLRPHGSVLPACRNPYGYP